MRAEPPLTRWAAAPRAAAVAATLLASGLTIGALAMPPPRNVPPSPGGPKDITIALAGDIAWPRAKYAAKLQSLADGEGIFARVQPWLDEADLRFGNLESPLSERGPTVEKTYQVITPPERLDWLLGAGFNLLSLANNHIADAGPEGIADTQRTLQQARDAGHSLWWAGAGLDPVEASRDVVLQVPGKRLKVAMIAVGINRSPLVARPHAADLPARVRAARAKADLVLVSVHAGREYQHTPDADNVRLYRALIDAGADLVIGHHPHVIQGVERRGRGLIFYSLGNFSFSSLTMRHRKSGARMYGLLPLVEVRDGQVTGARLVPLYVNNMETWTLPAEAPVRPTPFQPQPLRGAYARALLQDLQAFSAAVEGNRTVIEIRGDEGVVGAGPSPPSPPGPPSNHKGTP